MQKRFYVWLAVSSVFFVFVTAGPLVNIYFSVLPYLAEKPLRAGILVVAYLIVFVIFMSLWSQSMYGALKKWRRP